MNKTLYKLLDKLADDDVKAQNIGTLAAGAINGGYVTDSVSIPGDGTWTQLASFKLPVGVYLVRMMGRFGANATGTRSINLSTSSGAAADVIWNTEKKNAAPANYTFLHLITFIRVDSSAVDVDGYRTYYMNGSQNSGSTITVYPRFGAICLRNEYATTTPGGGGGGGSSDYTDLTNKPSINSVTLQGSLTSADLGLVSAVAGKDLSTNDYTNAEKAKVTALVYDGNGKIDSSILPVWNGSVT